MLIENDLLKRIWKEAVVSVVHALSQLSAGEAGNDCETLQSNSPASIQTSKSGTQFLSSNTTHPSALQGVDYSSQIAARFRCHAYFW
jgi:hypothetical protein